MLSSPVEEVLERAAAAGVGAIVTIGESVASSKVAVEIAERFDGSGGLPAVWAAVGVHPHEARHYDTEAESVLRQLVRHPRVVAVGETGLDFHYDHSPRDDQRRAFAAQVALAAEVGKPLVVHDREAHEEVYATLEAAMTDTGTGGSSLGSAVIHCFSGGVELARRFVRLGCWIAVGGAVTFKRSDALRAVAAGVPAERLLLETDAPYLSPEPYRGRENEPARLSIIAQAVADARGESPAEVAAATTEAARALFGV